MAEEVKNYSKELRDQILKEVKDTGNMAIVARNHGIKNARLSELSEPHTSTSLIFVRRREESLLGMGLTWGVLKHDDRQAVSLK